MLVNYHRYILHTSFVEKEQTTFGREKEWEDKLQVGITTLRQNAKELAEQQQQKLQLQDEVNQLVTKKKSLQQRRL